MRKPSYIVAARGLLRWSQDDLAKQCGVSSRTINLIENEKQNPSQDTLLAIELAFDRAGVGFKDNGVFVEDRRITVLEGNNCLLRLFDDIGSALQSSGELLIDGADERVSPPALVEKVAKLRESGMKMRHMVKHGDRYLRGRPSEYRWIPEKFYVNQAIFIYGTTVAIFSDATQSVLIHRDAVLSDFLRNKYDLLWEMLEQPDYSEAQDVFRV